MSFSDFSKAASKEHPVPTVGVSEAVTHIKSMTGLAGVAGDKEAAGLDAGRFYTHGVRATEGEGWRERFGYETPSAAVKPDAAPNAQPKNGAAADQKQRGSKWDRHIDTAPRGPLGG